MRRKNQTPASTSHERGRHGRLAARVPAVRVPALLHDRTFRRYWSGQTISMFGDQISSIALPFVAVLALHASPAQMGFLAALVWLPSLLFGLHAGAWVDRRGHRRATMIAADLGRSALLVSIPVSYAFEVLTLWQRSGSACSACCLPSATRRCSSRSSPTTSTWTATRSSTAAGRCPSSAGRVSAARSSNWSRRRWRFSRTRRPSSGQHSSWPASAPASRPPPKPASAR